MFVQIMVIVFSLILQLNTTLTLQVTLIMLMENYAIHLSVNDHAMRRTEVRLCLHPRSTCTMAYSLLLQHVAE